MNLLFNRVAKISALALIVSLPMAAPMGYNTRTDMLHTVNHKEEIDSLLNKKYTGDAAPGGSQIHQVKEVVSSETDLKLSRRALGLTAKNGYMINTKLNNVVTNILEASEIVERESMISNDEK
mmetsp:Transcript_23591/g.29733  ORF Transcript_23591/g.29733 Transcript_23591/m.29733 type:complete len:123 (+) Transcript_23591:114-482(+)